MIGRFPAATAVTSPRVRLADHLRVGMITLTMAALLHLDILFVKTFHPASVAAEYAALALISRTIFWSGVTVSVVLLPYVVRCAIRGEDFVRAYVGSLVMVALVSVGSAALVLGIPDVAYSLVFDGAYLPDTELLPVYACAATMLAIANITAGLHIGASHLRVWLPLAILALATIIGLVLVHETPGQTLAVMVAADAAAMLYLLYEAAVLARRATQTTPPTKS